ncbi:unnamed protein product [Dibothriocephalus latus]|uniref:CUB domain-containing protein n=1 Tax=Dibothriocephalus latus TaxID=60516 RepID=A0A3P7LX27_DIBLA|nr:unnamed protein product [Dibothriocephalus latus]
MDQGVLTSPLFPKTYPPDLNCVWKIVVPQRFTVVLTLESSDITAQHNCAGDHLQIIDGSSDTDAWYKRCGHSKRELFNSTRNYMTVVFVSNSDTQKNGFRATFKKFKTCGGDVNADHGVITSPGFPYEYPPNVRCVWNIKVSNGYAVALTFEGVDVSVNMLTINAVSTNSTSVFD